MSFSEQSDSIRFQAMELLAFSVLDLFPSTQLVDGKISNVDFYYDFIFEKPFADQALHLVEERWRKALKEFAGFKYPEMMRENAAGLFEHHHQSIKAEQALNHSSNIISLLNLGEFYDIVSPVFQQESDRRVYPKLFGYHTYQQEGLLITRLDATVFSDQDDLKAYQKLRKVGEKFSHKELGKKLELFDVKKDKQWFFHPRGEKFKSNIKEIFANLCEQEGFPFVSSLNQAQAEGISRYGFEGLGAWLKDVNDKNDVNCGLLSLLEHESLKISTFETGRILLNRCISSLQFIKKIIKIFDLNHEWVLRTYRPTEVSKKQWQTQVDLLKSAAEQCEIRYSYDLSPDNYSSESNFHVCQFPSLEMCVYDSLGRRWATSSISFSSSEGKETLIISPLVSLERFVALLLEQKTGLIPSWLLPEKVRVLLLSKEQKKTARALQQTLISRGVFAGLDVGDEKLAKKVELATQHQVPFFIVIREKEDNNGLIAVRRLGEDVTSEMELENFLLIAKQELERKLES
ncbi:hypothetical protein PHSC3_000515 [Chlamydiales bacterium STE3]|nr:hypothetical protein PHSC3_000515 [Chlamydiales bacterium STE3]